MDRSDYETMTGTVSERAADATADRAVAYLFDFSLLSVVAFVLWIITFVMNMVLAVGASSTVAATGSSEFTSGSLMATALIGIVVNAVLWLAIGAVLVWYFVYYADDGQTVGKRSQDVTVVAEDGAAPSKRQRLTRTAVLLAPFPFMALVGAVLGGVGFVIALFLMVAWLVVEALVTFVSDDARRIGDRLAGTYVVGVAD